MRQQQMTFQAIEVGDGGDGRWAAYARNLWEEMEGLLTEEGRTARGADRVLTLFPSSAGGPSIAPMAAPDACAANHQHLPVTDEQERALRTQEGLRAIRAAGTDVAAMLKPPLYRSFDEEGVRTLCTAHYRPAEGRVTYYWPGESWEQSFGGFTPGSRTVTRGRAD